jgi:type I restriction enzyme M protein
MMGAIIGDIAGSRFEFANHRSKDFELLHPSCFFTDDTVLTLAVGRAVLETRDDRSRLPSATVEAMRGIGRHYPNCGWGLRFGRWLDSGDPRPYGSFGNGAAMRVSACGIAARDLDDAVLLSGMVTGVTHDHPEGLKGAEAVVAAMFLARSGLGLPGIRSRIAARYYPLDFTIDAIRPTYRFNETCQDTVPQALEAFLESVSFEDAIRNAVSVGGDSDTLAAITGSLAEAYYGVPRDLRAAALWYLDDRLKGLLADFESVWPPIKPKEARPAASPKPRP